MSLSSFLKNPGCFPSNHILIILPYFVSPSRRSSPAGFLPGRFTPTSHFAPIVDLPLVYIRSSVVPILGGICLQTAKNAASNRNKAYFKCATVHNIGVAPIKQVRHLQNKNSNIQGRSLNVI